MIGIKEIPRMADRYWISVNDNPERTPVDHGETWHSPIATDSFLVESIKIYLQPEDGEHVYEYNTKLWLMSGQSFEINQVGVFSAYEG